eukprot:NODE_921_length_1234_cov_66.843882_g689_i0.p1 GENE.NODE_921_length_1234_cov_66.843882_g689_i0~~NODE_921_length_1234_cov_66.843882_g689_i0.p1  ORF type:complete len:309 (-),score=97.15 NODE_921_length_1234_cov_66.843882_g689_i0:254-1180(-)
MGDAEQTLKVVGGFLLVVVFTLAYVTGQKAQTKTQKNMMSRLDLTRQRFQNCDLSRRMLSGKFKGKEADELRIAEQDHSALISENQLLNEDNQQLRQDNYALEEQIDELRDELDDKDFVSDDEVEQLEDAMSLGNNSAELKEFLDDAQILGGINKDTLITKLMLELKRKRDALTQCKIKRHVKTVEGEKAIAADVAKVMKVEEDKHAAERKARHSDQKEWDDFTDDEKANELQKIVPQILTAHEKSEAAATELMKSWAQKHLGGMDDLNEAIEDAKAELQNEKQEEEARKEVEKEIKKKETAGGKKKK